MDMTELARICGCCCCCFVASDMGLHPRILTGLDAYILEIWIRDS